MSLVRRVLVSLDCSDPAALAAFWAALLGGEVAYATEDVAIVRSDAVWIATLRVPDHRPPSWPDPTIPKQLHLDLDVSDLDAAVAEAEGLGARAADFQPAPDRWRVLLDPAGHPFCFTTLVPRGGVTAVATQRAVRVTLR